MRRIALIGALMIAAAAVGLTSTAGAGDTHTYKIEMYNAFGIVSGSDLRIAGVNAGSVTDLDVTPDKRALVTVETSGPLSVLGKDTVCASQPQSLIAEYFLTCNPKGPPLPDGGTIPASQVRQTVQPDLVQNTLREPFKDRLQLLINEFGTALAGNPQDLNQAIELGSPALSKLKQALDILASENRTIRDLNANSDVIIRQLANRRQDVVRFIQEARDTSAISASRRADLSANFDRLDNFLHQLHPTLVKLGDVAEQQTPLLADLKAAAPGLNTLALKLPAFNQASDRSLTSLGEAAVPGKQALRQGKDEIQTLAASGRNAFPAANALSKFLLDIDSPKRTTEIDQRAARHCNNKSLSCYSTGRKAPTGYTGMESLLNYLYYQTGAINQFDKYGHLLHFSLFDIGTSPCGAFNAGDNPRDAPTSHKIGVPNKSGKGTTTSIANANKCVAWLGPHQPGINTDPGAAPYERPYPHSVCPHGSTDPSVCPGHAKASGSGATKRTAAAGGGTPATGGGVSQLPNLNPGSLPQLPPSSLPGNPDQARRRLQDLLHNGAHQHLPNLGGGGGNATGGGGGGGGAGGAAGQAANDLLNFLFKP